MATLALSRELFRGYARLERQVRNRVEELITIFQTSTVTELGLQGGVNLERHTNQRDPRARTLRITDNLRGIVCDLGDNSRYVLHEILTHADAEAWMRRKEFRANKKTGALEIIDFDHISDLGSLFNNTVYADEPPWHELRFPTLIEIDAAIRIQRFYKKRLELNHESLERNYQRSLIRSIEEWERGMDHVETDISQMYFGREGVRDVMIPS